MSSSVGDSRRSQLALTKLAATPLELPKERLINFCVANNLASLVWAANLADLELHTYLFTSNDVDRPTVIAFDLDPGPPAAPPVLPWQPPHSRSDAWPVSGRTAVWAGPRIACWWFDAADTAVGAVDVGAAGAGGGLGADVDAEVLAEPGRSGRGSGTIPPPVQGSHGPAR